MIKVQFQHDNPGWIGPGEPDWRSLLLREPNKIVRYILEGRMAEAYHFIWATLANLWNYKLFGRFRGHVECLACGWVGPAFLASSNWRVTTYQSICPNCGSRSRHRGLINILPKLINNKPEGPILFFAPELVILNMLARLSPGKILTTDFNSVDVDFPGEDIQKLSFPDNTFAMIICNHVLEHVPDDQAALEECSRVVKPGGISLFTIPGEFDKVATCYYSKVEPGGHYRHYGMDVVGKMQKAFTKVNAIDMGEATERRWGIRKGDYAFICIK